MNLHQEHHFEAEICASLAANGWLCAEGDLRAKLDATFTSPFSPSRSVNPMAASRATWC
ncbi:MAG: hypothetical protein HY020_01190 [Burkholderiales bacterium]|nr:hypothetical protein [Burkholderiales bacterium]